MTAAECPYPDTCPVGDPQTLKLTGLRLHTINANTQLFNVASSDYIAGVFNSSGRGAGRFSPITKPVGVTGHVYLGSTRIAALLETAFHEIGPGRTNAIDEANDLAGWHLRTFSFRRPLRLIDLRDNALARMGINRTALISSSPAHYRCTREWAHRLRSWGRNHDGAVWDSRIAEIAATRSPFLDALKETTFDEAMIIWDDHLTAEDLNVDVSADDLASPHQRALVDEIANLLDVAIL